MGRKEIFNHFSAIIDNLINISDFYKIYFQSCYSMDDNLNINNHLQLCTGLSRACLVDTSYDYVVKMDIGDFNCCEMEYNIYHDAQRNGVEKFFARPIPIGTYRKNIYFYAVEDIEKVMGTWTSEEEFHDKFPCAANKCEMRPIVISLKLYAYPRATRYDFSSYTEEEEVLAEDSDSPLREFNLAIAASFIYDYGIDEYNILTNFLYEWNIDDIHLGNVGTIDNHICIIDYAGFGEEYDVSGISGYTELGNSR